MILGEVPFDPTVHEMSDIKPNALMEMVTDDPYVELVRPSRPLILNVVTDYSGMGYFDPIALAKRKAASVITESLIDSLQSVTDRLKSFTVGARDNELPDMFTEELAGERAAARDRAEAVADLSRDDYTVVISDFSGLPLEDADGDYERTVGVKINHVLERKIPEELQGIGVIALSGGREANTRSARSLRRTNNDLERTHQETLARLNGLGIAVASLVTRADIEGGLDVQATDAALDAAFGTLIQK
jgi:hypothetical protein